MYEEYQDEIDELVEAGVLKRVRSRDGNDLEFTEDGWDFTKLQVGLNVDMQLFLFTLLWNNYGDYEDEHRKLVEIGLDLKEMAEINIFRTIQANEEKLSGVELMVDSLPSEFLQAFDPE